MCAVIIATETACALAAVGRAQPPPVCPAAADSFPDKHGEYRDKYKADFVGFSACLCSVAAGKVLFTSSQSEHVTYCGQVTSMRVFDLFCCLIPNCNKGFLVNSAELATESDMSSSSEGGEERRGSPGMFFVSYSLPLAARRPLERAVQLRVN